MGAWVHGCMVCGCLCAGVVLLGWIASVARYLHPNSHSNCSHKNRHKHIHTGTYTQTHTHVRTDTYAHTQVETLHIHKCGHMHTQKAFQPPSRLQAGHSVDQFRGRVPSRTGTSSSHFALSPPHTTYMHPYPHTHTGTRMSPQVVLNGQVLGTHDCGYTSFSYRSLPNPPKKTTYLDRFILYITPFVLDISCGS